VTIYSQVIHQPSGIRRFWFGVSLLSPLWPILRNGNPLLKFLGNALTDSDMVAKGMMKVHSTHLASTLVMETSKALE